MCSAEKLPFKDEAFDFYTISYGIRNVSNINMCLKEAFRVLKPGGINIYTARNTNDGDYKKGIHRGEDMYENDGFIINFFSEKKVNSLLEGFKNLSITNFDEGNFPRKLFLIQNKKL